MRLVKTKTLHSWFYFPEHSYKIMSLKMHSLIHHNFLGQQK